MNRKIIIWLGILFILILFISLTLFLAYKGGYFADKTFQIGDCIDFINITITP